MDIGTILLIVLLGAIVITPFVLIIIGIIRIYKENGLIFFMIGTIPLVIELSNVTAPYISGIVCKILYTIGITSSFHNHSLIVVVLSIGGCTLCYRVFKYFSIRKIKTYISYSRNLIIRLQRSDLPSCEDILISTIERSLKHCDISKIPSNPKKAAETSVYRTALAMIDSPDYRNLFGALSSTGEQLLHICHCSLDYFASVGYVSENEYNEHSDYLIDCDLNCERYSLYPQQY